MTEPLPHYAEAFTTQRDRCFRMVLDHTGIGRPMHCPNEVKWRGKFRTRNGKAWPVDSCDGHAHDVEDAKALNAGI